jgi:hypothetical protein
MSTEYKRLIMNSLAYVSYVFSFITSFNSSIYELSDKHEKHT